MKFTRLIEGDLAGRIHAMRMSRRWVFRFLPGLVLLCGLVISWGVWSTVSENRERELHEYFDFRVRQAYILTEQRMAAQEQVLRGVKGLFVASRSIERDEFRAYVASLHLEENYPGIQGVGFAQIVPPAQKAKHIAAIRKEGFPHYFISPEGEREQYTAIVYLEPFDWRNQRAFGYDMYSEPVRRAAMEQARDTGQPALSGRVTLVQETQKDVQAGFLIYLPFYRNGMPHSTLAERRANIVGWVYSPFRMNNFAEGIYGERAADLDIEIYDGDKTTPETLLYDSNPEHDKRTFPELSKTLRLDFAGHSWTMQVKAMPSLASGILGQNTSLYFYEGAAVSLLLAWLALLLVSGRERAVQLARDMNKALIHSEKRLRQTLDASRLATWEYDLKNGLVHLSDNWSQLLGGKLQPTTQTISELYQQIPEEERAGVRAALVAALKGENDSRYSVRHRVCLHDGTCLWVHSEGEVIERARDGRALRMLGTNRDITERKMAEDELRKLSTAVEQSPASVIITDADAAIQYVNPRFTEVTGYRPEEVLGKNPRMQQSGLTALETYQEMWHTITHGKVWQGELQNKRKSGELYWEDIHIAPIVDPDGTVINYVAVKLDISERKTGEQRLAESEANLRAILDNIPYLVWLKDVDSRFVAVNQSFFKTTGKASLDEVIGKSDFDLWPHDLAQKYRKDDLEVMEKRAQKLTEEHSLDQGDISWVETFKAPILDRDGKLLGTTGFARDITERKRAEEMVKHLAHYDALTDLPNRILFDDRLKQALATAHRDHAHFAVMFIDLDKFKPINDELGHEVGDMLLKEVARRMQHNVREMDTVARIGGDEFVVLLPEIDEPPDALVVAEKIRHSLVQPFQIAGQALNISCSVGIAVYPEHGTSEAKLLKHADVAMYQAKVGGRNAVALFKAGMLSE